MFVKDVLERTNKSKPRDMFTQHMRSECSQAARELRIIGDSLEARFHRTVRLEAAHQENNWRICLENIITWGLIKGLLLQM